MLSPRILLVVTSASRMNNAPEQTGSWYEEIAAPYYTFLDARCDVALASPLGGPAPLDATSMLEENCTAATRRFDADAKAKAALAATAKLSSLDLDAYDAVFFAGGHGAMEDFATDPTVKKTVEHFYSAGKPVCSVCHGPACFVGATKRGGEPLIQGHRFTCFTDEEETLIEGHSHVPFLLEARLITQGGISEPALPFAPNVVIDQPLVTGQNPASAIPAAEAVIHQLRQRQATRHAA